ncbi:hypothetical protein [Lutibacter profundi]|uniref:HU family DNA-binding protein n=1 Tax=Lutibacter profundi TaxID=1622118 RepID=UPI00130E4CBB|nr:hypothetical protein [Lutibacter profundi]
MRFITPRRNNDTRKVVRLGCIGSYQLGVCSNGFATEKQVTSSTINNVKINFRTGKELK